jgi:hypothetical protein
VLLHVGALNLSLVMRKLLGKGTPRGLQGYSADVMLALLHLWVAVLAQAEPTGALPIPGLRMPGASPSFPDCQPRRE